MSIQTSLVDFFARAHEVLGSHLSFDVIVYVPEDFGPMNNDGDHFPEYRVSTPLHGDIDTRAMHWFEALRFRFKALTSGYDSALIALLEKRIIWCDHHPTIEHLDTSEGTRSFRYRFPMQPREIDALQELHDKIVTLEPVTA